MYYPRCMYMITSQFKMIPSLRGRVNQLKSIKNSLSWYTVYTFISAHVTNIPWVLLTWPSCVKCDMTQNTPSHCQSHRQTRLPRLRNPSLRSAPNSYKVSSSTSAWVSWADSWLSLTWVFLVSATMDTTGNNFK